MQVGMKIRNLAVDDKINKQKQLFCTQEKIAKQKKKTYS